MNPTLLSAAADTKSARRLVLMGSPNSGKTTLFNALTGLRAKTGNYSGVTVDRKVGWARTAGEPVRLMDLPGTYSLHPISDDEEVAVQVIRGEMQGETPPDGILLVADSTTLERSLPMLGEVLRLGVPTCLVLTMVDELKARKGELDPLRLQQVLGVPVLGVVGNKGVGLDDLRARMNEPEQWAKPKELPPEGRKELFAWSDWVLEAASRVRPEESQLTRRLDAVLLHPVLGPLVFLLFMATFFQAIFTWAAPAMDWLSGWLELAADHVLETFPAGWLTELFADGVLRGVGGVVVFVPQIALLFAVILFLEACGYMARAAFVVDRLMGWVGLEGRCFIALLSSYACAVPGIMATRTIPSPRDRLATILVAPFTTCSARLPVYALLISTFVSDEKVFGPFTWQGLTLMGLYFLGGASALLFAAIFKRGLLRGGALPFYLELPPYRFPSIGTVIVEVWRRVKMFLRRAGTVILASSIVLWFLLNFPRVDAPEGASVAETHQQTLENSYAARAGKFVEPIFDPMGFDWRINVGLIGSFAAREVMVSTMAQVYAYADEEDEEFEGLGEVLTSTNSETGQPYVSRASAFALLAFFIYALQCVSTIAVIRRETNSWRWPLFCLGYMTVVAWLAGWVTYLIAA